MSRDEAMKPGEVESQLSAMFDGELPSVECELLSRRIDRDESLRVRWSHYALIGAAMRSEPVATARSDFAARVSSAVDAVDRASVGTVGAARASGAQRDPRLRGLLWQSALAAALVTAVAGFSILMLRTVALGPRGVTAVGPGLAAAVRVVPQSVVAQGSEDVLARARQAAAVLGLTVPRLGAPVAAASAASAAAVPAQSQREPWSYVTPSVDGAGSTPLRTELVDYIVAHSEYSTPLVRPDLLSELISAGEDSADGAPVAAGAADAPIPAGPSAAAGDLDAISPPAATNH
jgi:sigma-E factor negative regulatory protein RseA